MLVQRIGGADEPCFNDVDYDVERPIDPQDRPWSDWIPRDARGRVDPALAWFPNVLNLRLVDAGSR